MFMMSWLGKWFHRFELWYHELIHKKSYHRLQWLNQRPTMIAQSKLPRQKEAASSFCPFALVKCVLVAKVIIGEHRRWGDIERVVMWPLLAHGGVQTLVSSTSSCKLYHWAIMTAWSKFVDKRKLHPPLSICSSSELLRCPHGNPEDLVAKERLALLPLQLWAHCCPR